MSNEVIRNQDDINDMLDALITVTPGFWDKFYTNRNLKVPFFVNLPDKNLVSYVNNGIVKAGKTLDLGCGSGRNALYLARNNFEVDAVDFSEEAIKWAEERAKAMQVSVHFICKSVFALTANRQYDLVYDSGCMHHLLPHRRVQYIEMIKNSLKPHGLFGLTCFAPGYPDEGGSVKHMTDWDVYRDGTMNGGLAFTEEKLKALLSDDFDNLEFRAMKQMTDCDPMFGMRFLWTSLWRKKA